ncbi:DUF3945 domain-containing protein [Mucilaginibacter sp. SMC90]|uniref:DUF4099 domain-containing protein n=1 Tax=Mucilaginibacter sp. SMC90 TaxID=2929803 RepID=UPI001FB28632|nr:DUF4099 domain-containing protein [Mucilaginibacter sp. SMC90]UOE47813.1 DUF3945 domain-containing protein [Mucilaginibacter sp. SMC90]
MDLIRFKESELPMKDLEILGLAVDGQLRLKPDDLRSLLSGRRTSMLQLQNLRAENIKIKAMDAKISLTTGKDGSTDLLIHPVYRKPATPDFLDDHEAELLEKGEVANLQKLVTDNKGNKQELLVEYDPETHEFIVSDSEKILAPDMVNGEFLTPAQKEKYRKGKEVEVADHTKFSYSAVDAKGIRSDKVALIASVLIDGGLSYVAYKGLNALFNQKRDPAEAEKLSPGYHKVVADMEAENPVLDNSHIQVDARRRVFR